MSSGKQQPFFHSHNVLNWLSFDLALPKGVFKKTGPTKIIFLLTSMTHKLNNMPEHSVQESYYS